MRTSGVETSSVLLVPFGPEQASLVQGWLRAEHVARWESQPGRIITNLLDPRHRASQRLVLAGGKPVGFLQWIEARADEWAVLGVDVPVGARRVDIVVGVATECGKGIGSAALAIMTTDLVRQTFVGTASLGNVSARRAFQKCGFVECQQFYRPGAGRTTLMILRR